MSDISEIQVGGTTYTIADATARGNIANLHKATVNIVDEDIDLNGGAPSAGIYDKGIDFTDVDGNSIGFVQLDHETDGSYGIAFGVNNLENDSTHQIALEWKSNGDPKCWISQPGVVRNALSAAASSHTHGSISNTGAITSDTTVTSGDKLIIADSSDSSKLKRSNIELGTSTATFLRNDGTWAIPAGGSGGSTFTFNNEGLPITSGGAINEDTEYRIYTAMPDTSSSNVVAYLTPEDNGYYDTELTNITPSYGTRIYVVFPVYDNATNYSLASLFGNQNHPSMKLMAMNNNNEEVLLCGALPVVGGTGEYLYNLYGDNLLDTTAVFEFRLVNAYNPSTNEQIDAWMLVGGNPCKVNVPQEIVVSATEPSSGDTMLWVDPSNNATAMAAGVSF